MEDLAPILSEEQIQHKVVWGKGKTKQVPPLRSPEFLSSSMALTSFMRLSLQKAAHAVLS
jgi:hypothetical protein